MEVWFLSLHGTRPVQTLDLKGYHRQYLWLIALLGVTHHHANRCWRTKQAAEM